MKIQRKHVVQVVRITAKLTASAVVQGALRSNLYPTTTFQKVVVNMGTLSVGSLVGQIAGEHMAKSTDELIDALEENNIKFFI